MKLELRTVVIACVMFARAIMAASPGANTNSIVGTWELIDASPVTVHDSNPRGLSNHKLYYTADGKIYFIAPDRKFDTTAPAARYTFDGRTRKIITAEGEVNTNGVNVRGDVMKVALEGDRALTYRRMSGDRPFDRELEPRSLEVLDNDSHRQPVARYDTTDYSKQPLRERIRGVWEVVTYRHVKLGPDMPPFGLPNDKYVITGNQLAVVPPNEIEIDSDARLPYTMTASGSMIVGIGKDRESWSVAFDRWQRLVLLHADGGELILRLVTKTTTSIPELPVRIALLEE